MGSRAQNNGQNTTEQSNVQTDMPQFDGSTYGQSNPTTGLGILTNIWRLEVFRPRLVTGREVVPRNLTKWKQKKVRGDKSYTSRPTLTRDCPDKLGITQNESYCLLASACYGNQDQGVMIAAVGESMWNNGAACGTTYTIRCTGPTNQGVPQPCTGNSVTVRVVDRCAGCQANQFDLSQEAFTVIANPDAGRINIDYAQ
ncbi:hypothetical protein RJ639_030822 [Escallonia herrerae]|uniref:Expansin-like EG45 domain-containing protein n=1 Tax=Escallonia herrerae TaxID=1293975 RepID=A0AA88X6F8_9ASTE|nr:hypothetical protein RJ639_030822 [Escallonia herrerae]